MALPPIVLLCICGVFCLAPLTLYLAWLGAVNRRPRTTVMTGGWDFACLLAGLSGFILFGGGVLLTAVESNFRYAARGNWAQLRDTWGQERVAWGSLALGYVLVVGGTAALVVLARSRSLSVYNIDRARAEEAVGDVLVGMGLPANRFGDVWAGDRPLVSIDPFPGLRHVTVKIVCPDPRVAEEIERNLRPRLAAAPSADGPVSGWLYSAAVSCFTVTVSCVLLVALFVYLSAK